MTSVLRQPASKRSFIVVLLFWAAIVFAIGYNRQGIVDTYRLHYYHAPADVAQLATDDSMTSMARRIFYVNSPQIIDKQPFTDTCPSGTERTVVLGCYHSNQAGITVLKVTDSRLSGVEQVTAAHEMLHAAYDRLSSRQKQQVNSMLEAYYQHGLTDSVVKAQIADYTQTEPHDVQNEMHSLFGTEVANLPANLEQYYKQYFTNRAGIVQYYSQYQAELTSREATIQSDDGQLTSLKNQIDANRQVLDSQAKLLQTQQAQLNSQRDKGDAAAYNAAVPAYNAAVDAYNAKVAALRSQIDTYNALVIARNNLASETDQLIGELSNQLPTSAAQ